MSGYYVYALLDSSKSGEYIYNNYKFKYEPFYIGKGTKSRYKNTLKDKTAFKKNKIDKLKRNNIDIITIKVIENITNDDAIIFEKELISLIGRRDLKEGPLVNMTNGGDGRLNSSPSEETKRKISKNRKGKGIGWKHNNETLKIMSDIQSGEGNGFYGKTHTHKTKEAQSIRVAGDKHPMFGKNHTKEVIDKIRKNRDNDKIKKTLQDIAERSQKEVSMYSIDMVFIKNYKSVKCASIDTGINASIISKCCRGEIINPKRFFFKYINQEDIIKKNKFQININDKFFYNKKSYTLVKRNRNTAICEDLDKSLHTIRYKDCPCLTFKDTNDSEFIELYLYIKSLDKSFKIDRVNYIIHNDVYKFYYNKLFMNSDIFKTKKEIFNRFENRGEYKVINIFQDSWRYKKNIIKSRISNLFGKSTRIWGRKCVINIIKDYKQVKKFLNDNHIQGHVRSKVNIGLFHHGKLVSLMTFGSLRKNLGSKSKEGSWELLRFTNDMNTTVVGGASKLFNYFLKNYNPNVVVSYADRCWSEGNLYDKLGFVKSDTKITPNYFYIIDGVRKNRFSYRKDLLVSDGFDINMTEVEIQHSRGYYRIFDCGSSKHIYEAK